MTITTSVVHGDGDGAAVGPQLGKVLREKFRNSPTYVVGLVAYFGVLVGDMSVVVPLWVVGFILMLASFYFALKRNGWQAAAHATTLPAATSILSAGALAFRIGGAQEMRVWGLLVLLGLLIPFNLFVLRQSAAERLRVSHLPGIALRGPSNLLAKSVVSAFPIGMVIFVTMIALGGDFTTSFVWVLVILIMLMIVAFSDLVRYRVALRRAEAKLSESLRRFSPVFMLHWAAPRNTVFQISMWLPFLRRLGVPFLIVVRNKESFDDAVEVAGGAPVVLAVSARALERTVVPSIRAAFYVNNSDRNSHMVRFPEVNHIQLLHGDSEKAPSFNPVTAMFDRIYVAGQAGIDRYEANGVRIPKEKFAIVGRPQVEGVIRERPRTSGPRTVLYAPTWAGLYEDSSYSSLLTVGPLLEQILAGGYRIIFRAHPYAERSPELKAAADRIRLQLRAHGMRHGIDHLYGPKAEKLMSLVDCFNAADVMIADVSSVVSDFLYSGKPLGLMVGNSSPAELLEELPLAAGAYVFSMQDESWELTLRDLLEDDPLREVRHRMRTHYLGDLPHEGYADAFVETARRDVLGEQSIANEPSVQLKV